MTICKTVKKEYSNMMLSNYHCYVNHNNAGSGPTKMTTKCRCERKGERDKRGVCTCLKVRIYPFANRWGDSEPIDASKNGPIKMQRTD